MMEMVMVQKSETKRPNITVNGSSTGMGTTLYMEQLTMIH
jgi:hypothetical protein